MCNHEHKDLRNMCKLDNQLHILRKNSKQIYAICVNVTHFAQNICKQYTVWQIEYSHVFVLYMNCKLIMNYNFTFGKIIKQFALSSRRASLQAVTSKWQLLTYHQPSEYRLVGG